MNVGCGGVCLGAGAGGGSHVCCWEAVVDGGGGIAGRMSLDSDARESDKRKLGADVVEMAG